MHLKKTKLHKKMCPCDSAKLYEVCCQPFISGVCFPETPEQLMRSRYTAYTEANVDYIADTMCGPAAEAYDKVAAKHWAESVQWVRLKVLNSEIALDKDTGFVEFIAIFRERGVIQKMQERSEFHRIDGRWYYWWAVNELR